MGKHLQYKDADFEGYHPGCMWGLLHILDYHQWSNNATKLIPHKKHGGRRCIKSKGTSKETLESGDFAEAEPLLVKQHSADSITENKGTRKSGIKLSNAKGREKSQKCFTLSFHIHSWTHRTNENHLIEPSKNSLGKASTKEAITLEHDRRELSPKIRDEVLQTYTNKPNGDQLGEYVDILEISKEKKEFFMKFLQDPDIQVNHFHGKSFNNHVGKLTKSRSFPVLNSSKAARNIRPSTLRHKQNEIWFHPKGEVLNVTQAPKQKASKSQKEGKENLSSANMSHESEKLGWNQLVLNRFRDIKQKIDHALKDIKKENKQRRGEEPAHEILSSSIMGEMTEKPETTTGEDGNKIHGYGLRRPRVSRTSSLNESLARYTRLYEYSFGREAKYSHSRSLKLTHERKGSLSQQHAQKSYRRNLSLPDLDSIIYSFLNDTIAKETKTVVDHSEDKDKDSQTEAGTNSHVVDTDNTKLLDGIVETEIEHNMAQGSNRSFNDLNSTVGENNKGILEADGLSEDANKPTVGETSDNQEQDIGFMKDSEEIQVPIQESTTKTCFPDNVSTAAESEGPELIPQQTYMEDKSAEVHFPYMEPETVGNSDLSYVKDVLELSGFISYEQLENWNSMEQQPLSPSLFEELESCYHELECYGQPVASNRQLLFDLVNETLQEIIDKSYSYFPKAFDSCSSIRTIKGQNLLECVCKRVNEYQSLRPELDRSLDDVVARDIAKDEYWMNLKWEIESVEFELEDLIFDELLDEVLC